MIIDKYLKTWLPFDNSRDEDKSGNRSLSWHVGGTLNSSVVFHGANSNYFSSAIMYTSSTIKLGGQDFTIDFWVNPKEVSTATDIRCIFSVSTTYSSNNGTLLQISNSPKTGKFYFDYASDGTCDSTKLVDVELTLTALSQWVHVAIVYKETNSTITVYLNGQSQTVCQLSAPIARQNVYLILGKGVKNNGSGYSYGTCYIDEFTLYDDKALYSGNFTPPTTSFYDEPFTVVVEVDMEWKVLQTWRYENPGRADLLSITGGTTVTGLSLEQSVTGVAFYQPTRSACFGIPATKEIWIKCDIYTTANYANGDRLRIYNIDSQNRACGFSTNATISNKVMLWHNDISQANVNSLGFPKNRAFLLHMKSDATAGVVEFLFPSGASDRYTGNVNDGNDFDNVYIQMDGSNILVSNLVISNRELTIGDGALVANFDTERLLTNTVELFFDTERVISDPIVELFFDVERKLQKEVTLTCDTQRNVVVTADYYVDLSRQIVKTVTLNNDLERKLVRTEDFLCDLMRKIPHVITDNGTTLQSVNIILSEQQLTDNISFVHTGDIDIMDSVEITHLDYHNKCRAEETSTRGILQTCKCASDIDAILYQQMAYTVPESEWEWTPEYLQAIGEYNETHEEQVEKIPSAPASAHITSIAEALGKSVSLHFTDYISTMSTEVSSGTNYAGLISELFGWTSRLPQMMINCYLRGDTIYVVQRGHEQHTVTIDNLQLTVHTVSKKIVRTTWGSDPWSKTEVQPYYNDWSEFNQDSYNPSVGPDEDPEESGVTYEDDKLVEETTVKHGSETVVTRYEYQMLPDGKKFLYKETASTYSGGSKVDEVVTIHDPVSNTQSHVYAVDEDGVLGDVLTSSNHDDRVTPYQQMEAISGTGYYENGKYGTVVSDSSGQKYLLYGITYHQDKIDKAKRTINGVTLIDTSFPVDGQDKMEELTQAIMWLDRKTEETVTLDVYNYNHVIDFNDKISWHGNTYYLQSNNVMVSETIVNKQTLTFVRWY